MVMELGHVPYLEPDYSQWQGIGRTDNLPQGNIKKPTMCDTLDIFSFTCNPLIFQKIYSLPIFHNILIPGCNHPGTVRRWKLHVILIKFN